jgi:hypothetical protein
MSLPNHAAADVQRNGWGFGIADDDGATFDNPANTPQLESGFRLLQPRFFRTMLIWNGYEGVSANATQAEKDRSTRRAKWIARTYAVIDRAKAQGAQEILLTLRENDAMDYGSSPDPYIPTPAKYEAEIAKVVKNFASRVDIWGGANEPNLWYGPNGNRKVPVATLVGYQAALANVVNQYDPTALVTSPDFNDQTPNWLTYVNEYKAACGGFGNIAAFHPYADAESGTTTRTNQYAAAVPSGRNIWLTEVGVRTNGNLANQNTRVQQMVNPNSGLASLDRVTRIAYYHMRWDGNPAWDSGLLEQNQMPRPAWYTWCAVTHNDSAGNPDCTGYMAPPPSPPPSTDTSSSAYIDAGTQYVYFRGTDGAIWQWYYSGNWHLVKLGGSAAVGEPTAYVVNGNHHVYFRGTNGAIWQLLWQQNTGTWNLTQLGGAAASDPIGYVLDGNHFLYFRGTDNAIWQLLWQANTQSWNLTKLGGSAAGSPTAYSENGTHHVYFRGTNGAIWHLIWQANNQQWNLEQQGGSAAGDPVSYYSNGYHFLYFKGTDGGVWEWYWNGAWNLGKLG